MLFYDEMVLRLEQKGKISMVTLMTTFSYLRTFIKGILVSFIPFVSIAYFALSE